MNARKLKSVMVLHGDSGRSLSKYLGISETTFSTKLNRWRGSEFTQGEIQAIKDKYELTAEDVDSIFFGQEVS